MAEVLFKYLLLDSKYMDYGEFTKEEVGVYRRALRPLLFSERLTGYNIYPEAYEPKASISVNYMHNGLDSNLSKRRNSHKVRLLEKLESIGIGKVNQSISNRVVTRNTVYGYGGSSWDLDEDVIAIDEDDQQISLDKIAKYKGRIILQAKEYEMVMPLDSIADTNRVLEIFRTFCHKYEIDDNWDFVLSDDKPKRNALADEYAWIIPPITVVSKEFKHSGFEEAHKFYLQKGKSELSTILQKDNSISKELENLDMKMKSVLASRPFVKHLSGLRF